MNVQFSTLDDILVGEFTMSDLLTKISFSKDFGTGTCKSFATKYFFNLPNFLQSYHLVVYLRKCTEDQYMQYQGQTCGPNPACSSLRSGPQPGTDKREKVLGTPLSQACSKCLPLLHFLAKKFGPCKKLIENLWSRAYWATLNHKNISFHILLRSYSPVHSIIANTASPDNHIPYSVCVNLLSI